MKTSLFAGLAVFLSASAIASPAIANENDGKGWYGTAGIGFVSPNDPEGDECLTLSGSEYCADYELGLGTGLSGEIGIGYDFGKIRIEATYSRDNTSMDNLNADVTEDGVEVATLSTTINDNDVRLNSLMLNAYVDFDTNSKFVPYVGAGFGYTEISISSYNVNVSGETIRFKKGSDGEFGYQAKAGVSYLVSDTIDIFGEASLRGTSGYSISNVAFDPITAWGGQVGLRYRF